MAKPEESHINGGQITVHSSIPKMLFQALKKSGYDAEAIMLNSHISMEQISDESARIDVSEMDLFWREAVRVSGDELISVDFAEQAMLGSLYGLGFAWAASDSLLQAFERLARYFKVVCTAGDVELQVNEDDVRLVLNIPVSPEDVFFPSVDGALTLFLQLCRLSYSPGFSPVQVTLQRPKPSNADKFEGFFNCPLRYEASHNALFFSKVSLEQTLPMSNSRLARANDDVVKAYIEEFEGASVASNVLGLMIEMLPSGLPTLEAVAQLRHMTPRTLQRKLKAENTSFNQLLDTMRQDLAKSYLRHSTRSIGEIAYMLGFSDPANFTRFFKRWTGQSPSLFKSGE